MTWKVNKDGTVTVTLRFGQVKRIFQALVKSGAREKDIERWHEIGIEQLKQMNGGRRTGERWWHIHGKAA